MISLLVTNDPPETGNDAPQEALDLFMEYIRRAHNGQVFPPFRHQAEVFRHVLANLAVFLIAGTAAGKTLAIAIPLFLKLCTGQIRKIAFLYPTIALMEDQRRVMDGLAAITHLDVGVIHGGMSRAAVLNALSKPVILATPDAIYWFFRKNVKYSHLLIYGLAAIDEWILDEAHLINGLMLQNLSLFKQRIELLGECIRKRSRWHILSATPTPELKRLSQGWQVQGRSKCSDVAVTFHAPPEKGPDSKHEQPLPQRMMAATDDALAQRAEKVLVIFNTADTAHRLFMQVRGHWGLDLPADLALRFGQVQWSIFETWLAQEHIPAETVAEIRTWLLQQQPFALEDLSNGAYVDVPVETLVRCLSDLLEEYRTGFSHIVALAAKEMQLRGNQALEERLRGLRGVSPLLWHVIAPYVSSAASPDTIMHALDTWIDQILTTLERQSTAERIRVTAPAFLELQAFLHGAGISSPLVGRILAALRSLAMFSEQEASVSISAFQRRLRGQVHLCVLPQIIQDPERYLLLAQRLRSSLEARRLQVEARYIATWRDTETPVVLYTGKMTKAARDGLIDAFARLPRAILISTPAAELGVDFVADRAITEECEGNALLQRLGRIARREGIQGQFTVFLKSHRLYDELALYDQQALTRDRFSALIADPTEGLFPRRTYVDHSVYVEIAHWLVNWQLGAIGQWLNQRMFGQEVAQLAYQFQQAGLDIRYGLRTTLPSISLKDGAGSAEPTYILRSIENDELVFSDSPFELARSEVSYEEFLWRKPSWKAITVDIQATLEASQTLFWWRENCWSLLTHYGIANDYSKLLVPLSGSMAGETVKDRLKPWKGNLEGYIAQVRSESFKALLLRLSEALPLLFEAHAHLILGQGDVALSRLHHDGVLFPVEERLGNPLLLPEQGWLLLYGRDGEQLRALLKAVSAHDLEEVIYDWHTLERSNQRLLLLLDRTAGACFSIYRRLIDHVARSV